MSTSCPDPAPPLGPAPRHAGPLHRWRGGLVAALLAVVLLVGCSDGSSTGEPAGTGGGEGTRPETPAVEGDDDGGNGEGTGAGGTGGRAAPDPERYEGSVEGFYEVPDPLPPGGPGDLIRVQEVGTEDGRRTVRVMYHSRDAQDRDRATTGIVTHPVGDAPEGGWPVVAWAHGTVGLAPACAPSRDGAPAPDFGVEGVHVATDYIGLGPVGERHAYLSGESEAHSVVDAVRAARALEGAEASDRWVAVGHSQGGHAALFTNELGETYAPELDLLGTVAIAPAAALDRTFGPADQVVPRMVGVMALYGIATDHPELDPHDYLAPEVAAVDGVIDTGCLDDVVAAFVGFPGDTFFQQDPLETEPARSLLEANDPGKVAVDSPLLVILGETDTTVVPARVEHLVDQLCDVGQVTELVELPGDHGTVVPQAVPHIDEWFEGRLAGDPAPDMCRAGGGG